MRLACGYRVVGVLVLNVGLCVGFPEGFISRRCVEIRNYIGGTAQSQPPLVVRFYSSQKSPLHTP
jgi:hypothetical protein